MKITCPSCEAKYSIADEKVQGKVAKIRCKKCGSTIVVGGDGSKAPSAAAAESAGGATYTVNVAEGDQRTMSLAEVVDAYNKGVVTGETYVWAEGMDDWLPLASVPEVMSAIGGAAHQSAEVAGVTGVPAPASEPEAPVAAARRDPQRSKVDLFGGSGEEPAPAPTRNSSPPGAALMGASSSAANLTGARGEQSVLFSLNALAAAAGPAPAAPVAAPAKKSTSEDSGLIDLSALAKAAADQSSSAAAAPVALPLAPMLGAPVLEAAPAVAPSTATTPPPAKGNKSGLLIAGGLMFASLIIGGAIIMRPQPPPPAPAAPTAEPPTKATAEPTATAPTSSAVDPSAPPPAASTAAAPTAPVVAGKTPVGGKVPVGGKPPPAGAKTADPPPAAKTADPPKKPAGSPCGCAPADLMCNMNCSAKKKKLPGALRVEQRGGLRVTPSAFWGPVSYRSSSW